MKKRNDPLVTVCITHHNRPEKLRTTVEHLDSNTAVPIFVRVHDNGSDLEKVNQELDNLTKESYVDEVIRTEENIGPVRSRAMMLKPENLDTPYALILDDDMYVKPGWDTEMLSVFKQEGAVGVVGFRYEHPNNKESIGGDGAYLQCSNGVIQKTNVRDEEIDEQSYILVDDVPIGTAVVRREVLEDIEMPDQYFLGFGELSFWLRVMENGWNTALCSDPVFIHDKRDTDKKYRRTRRDWNEINKSYKKFQKEWGLRYPFKKHIMYEHIFRIPNEFLWLISAVKNSIK